MSLSRQLESRPGSDAWVKALSSLVFTLPGELLGTYLRIRHFDRGKGCWASLATIGAGLVSERQTRRHLRELEGRGLIAVARRGGGRTLFIRCNEPVGAGGLPAASVMDTWVQDDRPSASTSDGLARPEKQKVKIEKLEAHKQTDYLPRLNRVASDVVVSISHKEPKDVSGILPLPILPPDLAALPRERTGISLATLNRLVSTHGCAAVSAAVQVLSHGYPDGRGVTKGFGALLTKAVVEGWSAPELNDKVRRAAVAAATEAARPPASTKFARFRATGEVCIVERIAEAAVMIAGLRGTTAVMQSQWACWEWLENTPVRSAPSFDFDRRPS
jgi:hypothetical protein